MKPNKQRMMLLSILLLFTVPWLIAFWLYQHHYVGHPTSRGTLLAQPIHLSELQLTPCQSQAPMPPARWLVIYHLPKTCDATCKTRLKEMHQFWLASGKYQSRISLALIGKAPASTPYPTWCSTHMDRLPPSHSGIMLADPHGDIVLTYAQDAWQKPALKDLKHLLKWSQIG